MAVNEKISFLSTTVDKAEATLICFPATIASFMIRGNFLSYKNVVVVCCYEVGVADLRRSDIGVVRNGLSAETRIFVFFFRALKRWTKLNRPSGACL